MSSFTRPCSPLSCLYTLCLCAALTACKSEGEDETEGGTSAGEMRGGEMMAGEMMAGEMMGGEMMAGEMSPPELAIIGTYADEYSSHEISAEQWVIQYMNTVPTEPSVFRIERFDNEVGYLIAQNGARNEYAPGAWSRFDWILNGEELWYCQIAYEAESAEDAEAMSADPSDPSMTGCGGFPWSLLTAQ